MCVSDDIVLIHLARAADALEHTEEDDDPGSQEAEGQGPPDRTRVMKALTVNYTQHTLTLKQTNVYEYNGTPDTTAFKHATKYTRQR